MFVPQKERDTYKKAMKEFLETDWGASTSQPMYGMPPFYDHSNTERTVEKESTLKHSLKSCLDLMKDETTLNVSHAMIDQCAQDKEVLVS
jgi:hypothetical protein